MLDPELQPCCLATRPSSACSVRDGHLHIEEIDPVALAECIEAPFLLLSRRQIADNLAFIAEAFRSQHARTSLIYRAGLPLSARLCPLLRENQVRVEVASAAALALLPTHGIAASHIVVPAASSPQAVAAALAAGVEAISLSSSAEVATVAAAAASHNTTAHCVLCLDRELAGGWWARPTTTPPPSACQEIQVRIAQVVTAPELELLGLAVDLGPRVYEVEAYGQVTRLLCELADELASRQGVALQFIALGGGMVGEEIVATDADGAPLGTVGDVACTTSYAAYARAVKAALADRSLELRVTPGEGLLAGAATLLVRLAACDEDHHRAVGADHRLALVGDGWLLPAGADRVWHAPSVVANRAGEPHGAPHWLVLPDTRRSATGGAARHVLRRTLPPTTVAGDLLAFLDWGLVGGSGAIVGEPGKTGPTALLVDGERLHLLRAGAPS